VVDNDPTLAVRASGYGGRGYKNPITGQVVPGITTVCKYAQSGGLIQWAVDQTAAYAVANIDALLNRTEEQGWGFLRWYHKRTPKLASDPVRNAHVGVLNDLAELGTQMHKYAEFEMTGEDFPPPIDSPEMEQMVDVWDQFVFEHNIKPLLTEVTVWGGDYAGTFDCLWYIDGVLWLLDIKTARAVRDAHLMQLAALRDAKLYFAEDPTGDWEYVTMPVPEKYGFLHIRPDDWKPDGTPIPRFCELVEVSTEELDIYLRKFNACKVHAYADHELKALRKAGKSANMVDDNEEGE
jgi:hypothetical protein